MELNIFAYVARRCAQRLVETGYTVPNGSDEDIMLAYNNVRRRRVTVRPRTVHKSKQYSVPQDLVAGEGLFLADVAAGVDLRPYQSTGLTDAVRPDAMLFDFGIQHFHMGVGPHHTRPNFKARTDPLLFAIVTDTGIYCVGFYSHGSWSEQGLLDIVYENWPQLLTPFEIKGSSTLSQTYTDDDLAQLRRAGLNTFTQRPDGTIHGQPGGGVTTAGGSVVSTLELNQTRRICDDLERQICNILAEKVEAGEISEPYIVEVREMNGQLLALAPNLSVHLDAPLDPPPL